MTRERQHPAFEGEAFKEALLADRLRADCQSRYGRRAQEERVQHRRGTALRRVHGRGGTPCRTADGAQNRAAGALMHKWPKGPGRAVHYAPYIVQSEGARGPGEAPTGPQDGRGGRSGPEVTRHTYRHR